MTSILSLVEPSLSVHILWAPKYCVNVKSLKDMVYISEMFDHAHGSVS